VTRHHRFSVIVVVWLLLSTFLPITTLTAQSPVSGMTVGNTNLRQDAGLNFRLLIIIPQGTTLPIMGRNGDSSWLQVSYKDQTGWVKATQLYLYGDLNIVAVTQSVAAPQPIIKRTQRFTLTFNEDQLRGALTPTIQQIAGGTNFLNIGLSSGRILISFSYPSAVGVRLHKYAYQVHASRGLVDSRLRLVYTNALPVPSNTAPTELVNGFRGGIADCLSKLIKDSLGSDFSLLSIRISGRAVILHGTY
jgi:hypothetical protein